MSSAVHLTYQEVSKINPGATDQTQWSGHYPAIDGTKFWAFNKTEVTLGPSALENVSATNSAMISTSSCNNSDSAIIDSTAATVSPSLAGHSRDGKLPKNALELIVWAITECKTTTPTLTQIASQIQTDVATYRDLELSVLIKMVDHHLHRNTPAYFLPVMSPAGHIYHNPSLARWAINRQAIVVAEDGSILRRRHRMHPGKHHNATTSHSLRGNNILVTPQDGLGGPGSSSLAPYTSTGLPAPPYSSSMLVQNGAAMMSGSTMSMYRTTTGPLSGVQGSMGAGLYGVHLSRQTWATCPPQGLQQP